MAMIRSLFRSLEAAIHERLAMIEEVIAGDRSATTSATNCSACESMGAQLQTLEERIRKLEGGQPQLAVPAVAVPSAASDGCGKWFDALRDLEINLPEKMATVPVSLSTSHAASHAVSHAVSDAVSPVKMVTPLLEKEEEVEEEAEEVEEEAEEEVEEELEEELEEEAEEEVEEEAEEEAEEEEAEEEEEEGVEMEELTFKGKTYYKDPENNIYLPTDDGGYSDDPIGTWDVSRSRVLFKRVVTAA